ncbi:hypothetical protein V2J09_010305 [Rumex salicifolius]
MASNNKKHHHTTTTAATTKPKTYVYDLTGVGSRTPEYHPTTVVTKKPASKGRYVWSLTRGGLKKSPVFEQGKNRGHGELMKSPVLEAGRRSVSQLEDYVIKVEEQRRASLTTSFEEMKLVKGRKSASHVVKQGRESGGLAREVEVLQVKVLVSDMPGFMQVHAFRCARTTYDSLEKFSTKHVASNLKKEFDKVYGPAWHCIVGSSFGSFVTHSTGCFLYFSFEKLYVLLFRTKVRLASD